jgi:hypothetical protein
MAYRGPGFLAVECQQVVSLSQSSCVVSPVELTDGRGGMVWRRRESLVLYESLNTLWLRGRNYVDAYGEGPPLVEVWSGRHYGRDVHEPESQAAHHAVAHHHTRQAVRSPSSASLRGGGIIQTKYTA